MAENKDTIASFDYELRSVVDNALKHDISRQAIAGCIMSMSADFNTNKDLLAAYKDEPEEEKTAPKA